VLLSVGWNRGLVQNHVSFLDIWSQWKEVEVLICCDAAGWDVWRLASGWGAAGMLFVEGYIVR
jgi:hypothetical protein